MDIISQFGILGPDMWKKFLIGLAFNAVTAVVVEWARRKGKPWADELAEFIQEIKNLI